jgi:hypothetical protein
VIGAKNGMDECGENSSLKALNSVTICVIPERTLENIVSAHS